MLKMYLISTLQAVTERKRENRERGGSTESEEE